MRLLQKWRTCVFLQATHAHARARRTTENVFEMNWTETTASLQYIIQRHLLPTCTDFHFFFFFGHFSSLSWKNKPPPQLQQMFVPLSRLTFLATRSTWEKLVSTNATAHSATTKHFEYYCCCCFLTWISIRSSHYVLVLRRREWTQWTWVFLLTVTLECKTAVRVNDRRCLCCHLALHERVGFFFFFWCPLVA